MSWWWWGVVALCACAVASEDKRAEMSPLPFVLGSRYGRSPPAPRLLAPRNDRFFMGSRYGKRSELPPAGAAGLAGLAGPGGAARARLLCEYTGIAALYRCDRAPAYDIRYTACYGKRSELPPAGAAGLAGLAGPGGAARARLLCEYTGIAALYRCDRAPAYDIRYTACYGKRSELPPAGAAGLAGLAGPGGAARARLLCEYTGIAALYRCDRAPAYDIRYTACYGKRSELPPAGAAGLAGLAGPGGAARARLLCEYTGIAALYRCDRAPAYDIRYTACYGKRSELPPAGAAGLAGLAGPGGAARARLLCEYTGIAALYRCDRAPAYDIRYTACYGKRSELPPAGAAGLAGLAGPGGAARARLLCEYTGIAALYRCDRAPAYDIRYTACYGKRSELPPAGAAGLAGLAGPGGAARARLLCEYTGIAALYRCDRAPAYDIRYTACYGKRSELPPAGAAGLAGLAGPGGAARARLLCEYTGIAALYRCDRAPAYDIRRGSDEGDEE